MWSRINERESLWERATGREYGFENRAARTRRLARDADIRTDEIPVPSASRGRELPRKPSRAVRTAQDDIRRAKKDADRLRGLLRKLERQFDALQATVDQARKYGNKAVLRRAERKAADKKREIEEVARQLGRRR